ncbi:MAG: hypothetical protein KGL39_32135 [Patescibacteria group bacterium]|nr:hypothetical protein [Patescibacteria group bacterium]
MSHPVQLEVLRWPQFQAEFSSGHKQGEHVAIVGPTGSGKTLLGLELCKVIGSRPAKNKRPSSVTVLCYKPRDDTLREILPKDQWPEIKRWPPSYGQEHCIVWVRSGGVQRQRAIFVPLLDTMYQEGGQTVYIPEASHFERKPPDGLGMGGKMTEFWSAARSNRLTVVSDTQRPRFVTRSMWTEPQWVFIFPPDDEDDLIHVAKLSGRKVDVLRVVQNLGEHEFLCVRRQRGNGGKRALYVSRVDH